MKKIFVMMFALLTGIGAASAQEQVTTENDPTTVQTGGAKKEAEKLALQKEVYPQKEEDGDLYPREGHRARFPHGDQYVGHHRRRLVLHLQCEIRRRTAAAERRDVRLHP